MKAWRGLRTLVLLVLLFLMLATVLRQISSVKDHEVDPDQQNLHSIIEAMATVKGGEGAAAVVAAAAAAAAVASSEPQPESPSLALSSSMSSLPTGTSSSPSGPPDDSWERIKALLGPSEDPPNPLAMLAAKAFEHRCQVRISDP